MKKIKMASRYLIPLELCLAVVLISWGIAGWLSEGNLHDSLVQDSQQAAWGVMLILVGLFQFTSSAVEWMFGRRWQRCTLLKFLHMRSMASFLSSAVWVYAIYILMTLHYKPVLFATVLIQCLACWLFSIWSFIGNERARVVLDPEIKTGEFEKTIIADRSRLGDF